jgi:hypothetical protein
MIARNYRIRLSIATAAALLIGGAWAPLAMAQSANSQPDGPVACDAFQRQDHGSWTVLRPATIHPNGVAINLAPGQTFAPNQIYNGVEVTAVLDRNCGNP